MIIFMNSRDILTLRCTDRKERYMTYTINEMKLYLPSCFRRRKRYFNFKKLAKNALEKRSYEKLVYKIRVHMYIQHAYISKYVSKRNGKFPKLHRGRLEITSLSVILKSKSNFETRGKKL
jgi:hypothetical protein